MCAKVSISAQLTGLTSIFIAVKYTILFSLLLYIVILFGIMPSSTEVVTEVLDDNCDGKNIIPCYPLLDTNCSSSYLTLESGTCYERDNLSFVGQETYWCNDHNTTYCILQSTHRDLRVCHTFPDDYKYYSSANDNDVACNYFSFPYDASAHIIIVLCLIVFDVLMTTTLVSMCIAVAQGLSQNGKLMVLTAAAVNAVISFVLIALYLGCENYPDYFIAPYVPARYAVFWIIYMILVLLAFFFSLFIEGLLAVQYMLHTPLVSISSTTLSGVMSNK